MNIIRIYKILKAVLAISKTAVPVIEEIFQKDINKDGVIGVKK